MSQILVVGSRGTVGSQLVRLLKSKGHEVLEATSQKTPQAGQVHLNLVTGEGVREAFEKADKAFFLSPPGYTNQHELLKPLIEQAQKKQLKKVVLMTAMGANANPEAPMRKAELLLEKSGVPFNIIRPNWFMQNFNTFWIQGILKDRKIYLPVGSAKGSFIDARDIAAVAAELLDSDKWNNQEFDLTGAQALNHDQVARILSQAVGKQIQFQDIPAPAMRQALLDAKLPADYADFLIMILGYFKEGYSERTTDSVEQITGRKPLTFEQYAQDYKSSWPI